MNIFVSGIGTGVGKTVVSAILCEALGADYWKPMQAGNLDKTDTMQVRKWVSNKISVFHSETYRLKLPASPHHAAAEESVAIKLNKIVLPKTTNHLIIEGAGGLLVPLNQNDLMIDLIDRFRFPVILVSRHYLGSINHTLLSIEALRARKIQIMGIVFNGNENKATERIILRKGKVNTLGRLNVEKSISKNVIAKYAENFRKSLKSHISASK